MRRAAKRLFKSALPSQQFHHPAALKAVRLIPFEERRPLFMRLCRRKQTGIAPRHLFKTAQREHIELCAERFQRLSALLRVRHDEGKPGVIVFFRAELFRAPRR